MLCHNECQHPNGLGLFGLYCDREQESQYCLGEDCKDILLSILHGCDCFLSSLREMEKKAFARSVVTCYISGIMFIFSRKYFICGTISIIGTTTGFSLSISTVILQDPSYYRGHTSELNENVLDTGTPTTFRFLRML